jgi:hypothetical protein
MPRRTLSPVEKWAKAHGINVREDIVPLDHLHPNPWNPNRMDEATKRATQDSIAMFGFIDWPHVREHPDLEGHYQLLDGEHRVAEARALGGLVEIPCVILDIDTPTAMKLTVVLNQKGVNDDVALGALLGELEKHGGEDWSRALAFDDATLRHLIELGASDWTPPEPGPGGVGGTGGNGDGEWRTIEARVPADVHAVWEQARARAVQAGEVGDHDDAMIAAGMLIEVLAASYLAGPDAPGGGGDA